MRITTEGSDYHGSQMVGGIDASTYRPEEDSDNNDDGWFAEGGGGLPYTAANLQAEVVTSHDTEVKPEAAVSSTVS